MATKKKSSTSKTNKTIKKTTKKIVKQASKSPGGIIALILVLALIAGCAAVFFCVPINGSTLADKFMSAQEKYEHHDTVTFDGVVYDDFQVHFLELGNWYTGDSIYIKAGDTDILIDAGSRYASGKTIESFVDTYCTDGKLEYVIATHAHEDHISGFSGGSSKDGILYHYEIGTIIEFSKHGKDTDVYNNYVEARNYAKSKGAKVYTCLEAYNNEYLRTINIGPGMSMTTLYQKYYETDASTENNYSVCTLFTYNQQHYLFTGDLESGGEASLVEKNDIPQCELYKAGHHGSKTSSSKKLMEKVQPKVVCCCCCCGSSEYTKTKDNQFPTQEFINRVAHYTNNIYATTISTDNDKKTYQSMNGTICFSSNGTSYSVCCSNNNTVLKDTEWFKNNRVWPAN